MQDYSQKNKSDKNSNQDLYDIFVAQGIKLAAQVSDSLREDPNQPGIVGTVGDAMVDIVNKVENDGAKHGFKFGLDVLLHGSQDILNNLLRMSGIEFDEQQAKAVIGHMVGRYLDESVKTGKMSKEQIAQMGQEAQQGAGPQQPNMGDQNVI